MKVPDNDHRAASSFGRPVPADAPDFVRDVDGPMIAGEGDSAAGQRPAHRRHLPHRHRASGRSATSPSKFPVWDEELCIQCGKCVLVCPHAVIRAKVYDGSA